MLEAKAEIGETKNVKNRRKTLTRGSLAVARQDLKRNARGFNHRWTRMDMVKADPNYIHLSGVYVTQRRERQGKNFHPADYHHQVNFGSGAGPV